MHITQTITKIAYGVFKNQGPATLLVRTLMFMGFKWRRFYRKIFADVIIFFRKERYFEFNGKKLKMFYHRHNYTWTNERCVEIPIIMDYYYNIYFKNLLEFGYVLPHYYSVGWDVVDKYEEGGSAYIINQDIVDYIPKKKYDLILSISTIEHVGFDTGEKKEKGKIIKAVKHLKDKCLLKNGRMIFTTCLGYNPEMDDIVFGNIWTNKYFLRRTGKNEWKQIDEEDAKGAKYDYPYEGANVVAVLGVRK